MFFYSSHFPCLFILDIGNIDLDAHRYKPRICIKLNKIIQLDTIKYVIICDDL